MSASLNQAYGGQLIEKLASRQVFCNDAPVLFVNKLVECDFINIATGVFSPLSGFMGKADFYSVCQNNCLAHNDLTWTIPIVFDVDEGDLRIINDQRKVYLKSQETGALIGYLEPSEVYPHDKELRIRSTFGTDDPRHPGVKLVQSMKPYLLAGKVVVFSEILGQPLQYPKGVREALASKGVRTVAGFQTRNIPHRAHEYLQRVALELCDGLLIQPIIGWKKAGDFRPEVVKAVYDDFIREFYPESRVLLTFLNTAMRYAGPKEAVFHAIIRKNFGCSHFIVGRDHAGVGGFYGKYEAQDIFATLPDLGINILKLCGPFYCKKCAQIVTEKTCAHSPEHHEEVSGTKVREILARGSDPEGHFLRQEVLDSLSPFQKKGQVFYE